MYSTCLHCHRALGANEEVDRFPVGRTFAFDSAKGRLWVICPGCRRWNLSPFEERWEAVEWCERTYRDTRQRVATAEIGLARLPSGLELVRIGRPLRPEIAAWRYGRTLGARHRRAWWRRLRQRVEEEPGMETLGRWVVFATGGVALAFGASLAGLLRLQDDIEREARVRGVRIGGRELPLTVGQLEELRLDVDPTYRWRLHVPYGHDGHVAAAQGAEALQLLGRLLVHLNDTGASSRQVRMAVAKIEHFGSGERLVDHLARMCAQKRMPLMHALGYEQRLAIEMIAHEEQERRAMEGELAMLAQRWREAEEVAAIADGLLTPFPHG